MAPSRDIPFEKAFQRLEEIVDTLEKGESSLEEAMKAFEEGMELAKLCTGKLNQVETRLQKLIKGESGDFRLEPAE